MVRWRRTDELHRIAIGRHRPKAAHKSRHTVGEKDVLSRVLVAQGQVADRRRRPLGHLVRPAFEQLQQPLESPKPVRPRDPHLLRDLLLQRAVLRPGVVRHVRDGAGRQLPHPEGVVPQHGHEVA